MHSWSQQQEAALKAVHEWLRNPGGRQWFYLAGFAGSGKTTLATHLASGVEGRVLFGAFTGKAALVMRSKGCEGASTIHSMIYRLDEKGWGGEPKFVLNEESAVCDARLVVIDEVSMVGEELAMDLLSFNKPVLVLGDPAQLPPVRGTGFFTARDPDFMLSEVHRQARDNPIIALSMDVREGRKLSHGSYGPNRIIPYRDVDRQDILKADQVLVGINRSRRSYNARIRELRGYGGKLPNVGERLICLKNNSKKGLLNGQTLEVASADFIREAKGSRMVKSRTAVSLELIEEMALRQIETKARIEDFLPDSEELPWQQYRGFDRFDYGYAVTVHKAQGSQWDDVYLFDESSAFGEESRRWLYTGLTRAAERITVVM